MEPKQSVIIVFASLTVSTVSLVWAAAGNLRERLPSPPGAAALGLDGCAAKCIWTPDGSVFLYGRGVRCS
eukprot:jgi/Botrbrau1/1889/Bobra.0005s0005.1